MAISAHSRAVSQLLLAALCWSLGGLLIKSVDWPPLAVAGGRGIVAAVFLIVVSRPLRFHFSGMQVLGAVAYAACTVTLVTATKMTTAANAILLQYTAPVWIALLGTWFLGERANRADWFTIGAVLAGMALFVADGLRLTSLTGNLIGAASGVCFAIMTLALRHQKDGSPVESIILGNVLAFLIGLPEIIAAPSLPTTGWSTLLILGTVQLGVSYWLYARAIRHVTALEAVLIPVLEPLLSPVWVLLFIGEKPSALALVGGALVLSAVTLRARQRILEGRRRAAESGSHA